MAAIVRECRWRECGRPFIPWRPSKPQQWCSKGCRAAEMREFFEEWRMNNGGERGGRK